MRQEGETEKKRNNIMKYFPNSASPGEDILILSELPAPINICQRGHVARNWDKLPTSGVRVNI